MNDTVAAIAPGAAVLFRAQTPLSRGENVLVTIPLLSFVAKDEATLTDTAGNVLPDALSHFAHSYATSNEPTIPLPDDVYQRSFVDWIKSLVPGVWFGLDNEPDIWQVHHGVIQPHPTYDEVITRNKRYAKMITDVIPDATIFGPVLSGWEGARTLHGDTIPATWFIDDYLTSMQSAEADPVYGNRQLLHVLDVHWYPQKRLFIDKDHDGLQNRAWKNPANHEEGIVEPNYYWDKNGNGKMDRTNDPLTDEYEFTPVNEASEIPQPDQPHAGVTAAQRAELVGQLVQARLDAPRSLWDPDYKEDSFIQRMNGDAAIAFLPTLKKHIADHYPKVGIGLTEYYFGGKDDMTGALAQADALGIFAREGVFAAAFWEYGTPNEKPFPKPFPYPYAAFDMFQKYDGGIGKIGTQCCTSTTSDKATSSIYGTNGIGTQLIAVALNRSSAEKLARLQIQSCHCYDRYVVYQLTGTSPANTVSVSPLRQSAPGAVVESQINAVRFKMPAYSISTIVAYRKPSPPPFVFRTGNCKDW
ncbi:MAG TPA: glycoside hydrolase family 44 protein [Gemmatimonadaceae bacterium]